MSVEKEFSENKSINLSGSIHLVEDGWNYDVAKGIVVNYNLENM